MPFWLAALLLIVSIAGIVLSAVFLKRFALRLACILACSLASAAFLIYLLLTVLFVSSIP